MEIFDRNTFDMTWQKEIFTGVGCGDGGCPFDDRAPNDDDGDSDDDNNDD